MGYYVKKIEVGNNNKEKYFDLYEGVPGSKSEKLIGRFADRMNQGESLKGDIVDSGLYSIGKIKDGKASKIGNILGTAKVGEGQKVIKYRKKSADKRFVPVDESYTYKPETPKRETPKTSDESKTSENAVGEFLGGRGGNRTPEPETKAPETKAPETKAPETKAPEMKAPEMKAVVVRDAKAPTPAPANKVDDYVLSSERDRKDVLKDFEAIRERYKSLATEAKNNGITDFQDTINGFGLRNAQDTIAYLRTVIFNESHAADPKKQGEHVKKMIRITNRADARIDGYRTAKDLEDTKLEKKAWKDLKGIYEEGLDEIEREMSDIRRWVHSKKKGLKGFFTSLLGMESLSKRTVNACFKKVGKYFKEKNGEDFEPLELYKLFKDMKKDAKEWYETVKYALSEQGMSKFKGKDVKTISFVTILLSMVKLKKSKFIIEAELGFANGIPSSGALVFGDDGKNNDKGNDGKNNKETVLYGTKTDAETNNKAVVPYGTKTDAKTNGKEIPFSEIKTLCKNIGAVAGDCDWVERRINAFVVIKTKMMDYTTYRYIRENLRIED